MGADGKPLFRDHSCSGSAPLVMGAARGHRTFFVGPDGLLRGVTYRQAWAHGENEARCMVTRNKPHRLVFGRHTQWENDEGYVVGGLLFRRGDTGPPEVCDGFELVPCGGLDPECGCGFYAFYADNAPSYAFTGLTAGWGVRAQAVVEGYGRVVLGPKGYRASKARVVALCLPRRLDYATEVESRRAALTRMRDQAVELREEPLTGIAFGTTGFALSAVLWGIAAYTVNTLFVCPMLGSMLLAYVKERRSRTQWRANDQQLDDLIARLDADLAALPPSLTEVVALVERNYPGVPIYHDQGEMYAAHPIEDLSFLVNVEQAGPGDADAG